MKSPHFELSFHLIGQHFQPLYSRSTLSTYCLHGQGKTNISQINREKVPPLLIGRSDQMFLSARWWMRGLQYLRRKLRIKSRSFTSWLKNCVLAGRGGRCRQRKMLIYSRSEGEKKTTPRIMSLTCTYSILVPVCIALSCVQKMDSEPLLNFSD